MDCKAFPTIISFLLILISNVNIVNCDINDFDKSLNISPRMSIESYDVKSGISRKLIDIIHDNPIHNPISFPNGTTFNCTESLLILTRENQLLNSSYEVVIDSNHILFEKLLNSTFEITTLNHKIIENQNEISKLNLVIQQLNESNNSITDRYLIPFIIVTIILSMMCMGCVLIYAYFKGCSIYMRECCNSFRYKRTNLSASEFNTSENSNDRDRIMDNPHASNVSVNSGDVKNNNNINSNSSSRVFIDDEDPINHQLVPIAQSLV